MLTNNGPITLDATCSFRKIWPKVATYRIDIRPETNPDIIMDARELKFPNAYFDIIYCDPPHLIHKGSPSQRIKSCRRLRRRIFPDMFTAYGYWQSHKEFHEFVEKTNNEFYRCLKPKGLVKYKMTNSNGCVKTDDLIEKMTHFEVIEHTIKKSKSGLGNATTSWITFRSKLNV